MLLLLPVEYGTLKDRAIDCDTLPTSIELRTQVSNKLEFAEAQNQVILKSEYTAMAFASPKGAYGKKQIKDFGPAKERVRGKSSCGESKSGTLLFRSQEGVPSSYPRSP